MLRRESPVFGKESEVGALGKEDPVCQLMAFEQTEDSKPTDDNMQLFL